MITWKIEWHEAMHRYHQLFLVSYYGGNSRLAKKYASLCHFLARKIAEEE